ncbi:MAG: ABC transporter permease [Erysipelotrichaceae bacterium]
MSKFDIKNIPSEMFEPAVESVDAEGITSEPMTFWQDSFKRLLKNKIAIASLIIIAILVVFAVLVPIFSPYSVSRKVSSDIRAVSELPPRVPLLENIGIADGTLIKEYTTEMFETFGYKDDQFVILDTFTKNDVEHVRVKEYSYKIKGVEDDYFFFGTDILGRDMWTRVWYGTGVSLLIGFYAAIIYVLIGTLYGGVAGYNGGTRLDDIMMRIIEILWGIPSIVILFILFMFMEPGIGPIAIAIALTGWIGIARMVRAQFLRLRNQEFVLAARTLGASPTRIITKHLIPNVMAQIIVMASFSIPGAIFYEAFLAFIGIGLNPAKPSLGVLINDALATTYGTMPYVYLLVIPCVILSVLMLSINLLSNGLRDALDPRMRGN